MGDYSPNPTPNPSAPYLYVPRPGQHPFCAQYPLLSDQWVQKECPIRPQGVQHTFITYEHPSFCSIVILKKKRDKGLTLSCLNGLTNHIFFDIYWVLTYPSDQISKIWGNHFLSFKDVGMVNVIVLEYSFFLKHFKSVYYKVGWSFKSR